MISCNFKKLQSKCDIRGGVLIYAHPFYEWVEDNITNISIPLLKAIITNIVPLEANGRIFFNFIASLKVESTDELMKLYDSAERGYKRGKLKPVSYLKMQKLGYNGQVMKNTCPVYDVLNFIKRSELSCLN